MYNSESSVGCKFVMYTLNTKIGLDFMQTLPFPHAAIQDIQAVN